MKHEISPLKIQVMLHYYALAGDYEDGDYSNATIEAFKYFLNCEMLENSHTAGQDYGITKRGCAYAEALTSVQLPELVETWVVPK